jgi:AcrR family transcriptional regulator
MSDRYLSRGERTRGTILDAAHRLFITQGYHGTSMRQIAQQAGVALGGLYNHFANKEDVFKAVFYENHPYNEIVPALLEAQGDDIETFVDDAAKRLLKSLENRPDFLNLMFIELVEFNNVHVSQLLATLIPQGLQIAGHISLVGQGRLRPIPLPMLIRTFLGMFFSYYITELIISPVAPSEFLEGAMDHFVDIYLHGILTD